MIFVNHQCGVQNITKKVTERPRRKNQHSGAGAAIYCFLISVVTLILNKASHLDSLPLINSSIELCYASIKHLDKSITILPHIIIVIIISSNSSVHNNSDHKIIITIKHYR